MMFSFSNYRYRALSAEHPFEKKAEMPQAMPLKCATILCFVVIACMAFVTGVLAGPYLAGDSDYGLPKHCGDTIETWFLNKTFAGEPTPESEAAWQSIIPEGRGFVTHHKLAPVGKDISVFHQIHCLHSVRVAYFRALHDIEQMKNVSYTDPFLENIKASTSTEHLQHCFDYLRRALMCAADTNLESVNPGTNEISGWGFERTCRDYWQVVRWAEKWKNNRDHSIL